MKTPTLERASYDFFLIDVEIIPLYIKNSEFKIKLKGIIKSMRGNFFLS